MLIKGWFFDWNKKGYFHSLLQFSKIGTRVSKDKTILYNAQYCLFPCATLKRVNLKEKIHKLENSRYSGKARYESLVLKRHLAVLIHKGCL